MISSPYFSQPSGNSFTTSNCSVDDENGVATNKKSCKIECSDDILEKSKRTSSVILDEPASFDQQYIPSTSLQDPSHGIASPNRLTESFYDQECITLAKALLGKLLVRLIDGVRVTGSIVETESYLGGCDVASHSYNGKKTPRNEAMYMKPGTAYVYPIYGMYYCFNISSRGEGGCVLIRALDPQEGVEEMKTGRSVKRKNSTPLKLHQICNGPSKLCQALHITKDSCNKLDLNVADDMWLEDACPIQDSDIITTKRIGIESAGQEWANKPLRFYVYQNKNVSVRDKKAESKVVCD